MTHLIQSIDTIPIPYTQSTIYQTSDNPVDPNNELQYGKRKEVEMGTRREGRDYGRSQSMSTLSFSHTLSLQDKMQIGENGVIWAWKGGNKRVEGVGKMKDFPLDGCYQRAVQYHFNHPIHSFS